MRRRHVLILGCVLLLLCMTGCALQTKEKKLRDVEYTVVGAEDVPQELQEEINKIKDEEFQLTYDDGAYLYMAKGYGTRESSDYNISVQQVYLTEHTIVFETQITGPAEGTDAANKETTPYIVIKTERLDGQVIFE
jgi:hypothetical protein